MLIHELSQIIYLVIIINFIDISNMLPLFWITTRYFAQY